MGNSTMFLLFCLCVAIGFTGAMAYLSSKSRESGKDLEVMLDQIIRDEQADAFAARQAAMEVADAAIERASEFSSSMHGRGKR